MSRTCSACPERAHAAAQRELQGPCNVCSTTFTLTVMHQPWNIRHPANLRCPALAASANDIIHRTHLSCRQHRDYYSSYGDDNADNFLHGGTRNLAGHCSWELRRIWGFGTIYEPDGRTQKYGTVRGMCTIYDQAEECNKGDKDGGPLCGGMTITIDGCEYGSSFNQSWGAWNIVSGSPNASHTCVEHCSSVLRCLGPALGIATTCNCQLFETARPTCTTAGC